MRTVSRILAAFVIFYMYIVESDSRVGRLVQSKPRQRYPPGVSLIRFWDEQVGERGCVVSPITYCVAKYFFFIVHLHL